MGIKYSVGNVTGCYNYVQYACDCAKLLSKCLRVYLMSINVSNTVLQ